MEVKAMRLTTLLMSLVLFVSLFVAGCGPQSTVKEGDLFEVLEEVRVSGESRWADGSTEGFNWDIPGGTVVKALYSQRAGLKFFECIPTQVEGVTGEDEIVDRILPVHLKSLSGFEGLSLTINLDLIGTKLKKLEQ